ncbi:putative membrane protein [Actinoalloteichus hoggarensis]|uniref:Bacterial membrane flanked domain protein n=1 Tax=Actinoalloteichus hoggarensis TaxID=1470176 RepID=A0A221W1P4_9PSEU|nr:PH domain-containing protein [Actinoalloteichus hoggarensis]ASO19471.1 Bacterial membrane flanked domain protein [Actinoalloteichus hoggarensis]MBB5919824.1 putative membrane protein [Actinoalloteichus hoggarensis]
MTTPTQADELADPAEESRPAAITAGDEDVPWRRLDIRMVWIDLVMMVLSLIPFVLATVVFDVVIDQSAIWPTAILGVVGVGSALADLLRWVKTRYRITDERVEYRSGLLVRTYRSVRRDRIRSIDTTAKLRHRVFGLRVVNVRAGAQSTGAEAELELDAVSRAEAEALRRELTGVGARSGAEASVDDPAVSARQRVAAPAVEPAAGLGTDSAGAGVPRTAQTVGAETVLSSFRWQWLVHNMFSVWGFVAAAGLLWGAHWLSVSFGLDLTGDVVAFVDGLDLPLVALILLGILAAGALGSLALTVNFFAENWRFRLSRMPGAQGTVLHTSQGLFKTREINRDDRRLRGVEIAEPLLLRWLRTADTNVIATGLSEGSTSENAAAAVLPRVPVREARRVAGAVLADDRPFMTTPIRHPAAAMRRRAGWAVLVTALAAGLLAWLGATVPVIPDWAWQVGLGVLPLGLVAAVLSYRSLGHALVGDHLVTRSGLTRTTAVLRREAVIGWTIRQSVLQRRLGLMTVGATTAAGYGLYAAIDLDTGDALRFARSATPELLRPCLGGTAAETAAIEGSGTAAAGPITSG